MTAAAVVEPAPAPAVVETMDRDGPLLHTPTARPQWMHYGDHIRILGTVAVVVGHVSDMTLYGSPPLSHAWWVCNWWDAAARWAVPVYIMLSGSLLLDPARGEPPGVFYRKRLARLGVPLVFWSAFFMWLDVYYTGWRASVPNPAYEVSVAGQFANHYLWSRHTAWQWVGYLVFAKPRQAWLNLMVGEPYMHMHFIFRIAGLYAFTPLLRVVVRAVSRPMLTVGVVMMLVLSSADSITNNFTDTSLSMFARFVPFLGYYLFGYLLREGVRSRAVVAWSAVGLVVSIVTLAVGTGWLVGRFGMKNRLGEFGPPSAGMMLYDFLSPVRVLMAVCSWVVLVGLFRDPWPRGKAGRSAVRFWANTTLGLYLIHPLFRELWYMGLKPFTWNGKPLLDHGIDAAWPGWHSVWIGIPATAALVYVPALVATVVLMRIPGVRRITG